MAKKKKKKKKAAKRKKERKGVKRGRKKVARKKKTKKKAKKRVAKKTKRKVARKKKAKKKAKRKTVKKAKKKKKARKKRKLNPAFMKPLQPSVALAAVVGSAPLPRTQVIKKLWAYIKRHGLQDMRNRRMINADAALKPVFGGRRQVSMFQMTALVSKHLK